MCFFSQGLSIVVKELLVALSGDRRPARSLLEAIDDLPAPRMHARRGVTQVRHNEPAEPDSVF